MINNTNAPAKLGTAPDLYAAGNTGKGGHQRVFANIYIMSDVAQIIELHPRAQKGVTEHTPVNGAVRANAHLITQDHPPEMGQLHQTVRSGGQAKTGFAQNAPGANAALPANQGKADYRARADMRALSYFDAGPNNRVGADLAVIANPRACTDRCACRNDSAGSDAGGRVNRGKRHPRVRHHQLRGNTRKGSPGMGMDDECRTVAQRHRLAKSGRADNDALMRFGQIGLLAGSYKYQRARRGRRVGGNVMDATRRVSGELTIELAGNLPCVQ